MRTVVGNKPIARAILAVLLLAGCDQRRETVSFEDSEGRSRSVEVKDQDGIRTVTSDDGLIKAEGTRGRQNARFPDYAPQYPGATIQTAVDMTMGDPAHGGVKQHIITQHTSDSPDTVMAFYKSKALGKRSQILKSATGPMLIIGGTSLMDMEAAVTAMPVPSGGTSVNVTVQERLKR